MTKQDGKVFIGGLSWETTDDKLRRYFENYGTVQEAFVSYDRHTGRPRGFGFVVFADPVIADKVVAQQHTIDRREVEAKKALPKEESPVSKDQQAAASGQRTKKIFVGGLAPTVDEAAFRQYFEDFGTVEDAVVMYDHENRRPRGFGFVTFSEEESVDQVFMRGTMQTIHDKQIEIKRAVPRDSMMPSPRTMYRPAPHQQHYYEGRSPYMGRYTGPRGGDRGNYSTPPRSGYGRGRSSEGGRHSPMPGGRGMYTPPVVVTGIPASMAGTPGGEAAMAGAVMTPVPPHMTGTPVGPNGMMGGGSAPGGVPPHSPVAVTPTGALQSTPPGLVGGFAMQNGMPSSGGSGQFAAAVGSPPLSLDQASGTPQHLADLQQLSSVTGALEQLQVSSSQQQQTQAQQAQQQAGQQGQQPGQQTPPQSTTIWS